MEPPDEGRESEEDARERMAQLMRRAKISLADVEARLGLQGTVVAAYVFGSRLWGTATDGSDFDIFLVARQREPHRTLHWGSVDALVYSPEEWQKQLDAHYVFALVCSSLSGPWVWKAPSASLFRPVAISRPKLRQSVMEETDRDWQFALKCYGKGQTERAQKTLSHALRLCLLAVQIAEHGRPTVLHSLYAHPALALPSAAFSPDDAQATIKPELDRLRALI